MNGFWNGGAVQFLGRIRLVPDTLIILGAASLRLFMFKAVTGLKPVSVRDGEQFD